MDKRKTVIVVEDEVDYQQRISKRLIDSGLVSEVVVIDKLQGAEAIFDEMKHRVDAVLMDACLEHRVPDTFELTRHIRSNFPGVMVAMSRDPGYRRKQREAGCDHESPKSVAAEYLLNLLRGKEAVAA